MRIEAYFDSCGLGKIRYFRWMPEGRPKGILQIVHGIAEHALRYDEFANFLTENGYMVVAEDHMGHGRSVRTNDSLGYFHGGWFSAVEDTFKLLEMTKNEYEGIPYYVFGHSMGSFMTRTILIKYPNCGIQGCVLSGTGWQNKAILKAGLKTAKLVCKLADPKRPSKLLHSLAFGTYNKKVEHPRTSSDWLTRSSKHVDAYESDPLCGFIPSAGLMRDMLSGIEYIQRPENLIKMNKALPVYFISGGDDPVGDYGKGVCATAAQFKMAGMTELDVKIYPLCRHELLNEINHDEVYSDILMWLDKTV